MSKNFLNDRVKKRLSLANCKRLLVKLMKISDIDLFIIIIIFGSIYMLFILYYYGGTFWLFDIVPIVGGIDLIILAYLKWWCGY